MIKKGNYTLPKYRKGQKVSTPDGEGHIIQVAYEGGANWYRVKEKFYGEVEIKLV